jgi:hypothetical protein
MTNYVVPFNNGIGGVHFGSYGEIMMGAGSNNDQL